MQGGFVVREGKTIGSDRRTNSGLLLLCVNSTCEVYLTVCLSMSTLYARTLLPFGGKKETISETRYAFARKKCDFSSGATKED